MSNQKIGICLAYLSAGSNLGDRKAHLGAGIEALRAEGIVVRRISSVFETEPVGFLEQPWFLNIALEVATDLSAQELLRICLTIEAAQGRVRTFQGAPRALDIDILLFGNRVIHEPGLEVPHPRMAQRRFVLEPLAEIAPGVIHPLLQKDIRSLLASCPDSSRVLLHSKMTP